ncbi:MAG: gluconate 2-dehydrogenase subunit 3 family protein [Deltaproteobacteria bacterium]|nr:gluconate 2-dehydrogenase subunit 3 family protein [Deltaproteobacteria bacterium]
MQVTPRERATIRAIGETLLPAGGPVPPSSEDAGVATYIEDYLAKIPLRQSRLLRLLFSAIEYLPLLTRFRRFSALPVEARAACLRAWERSRLYVRRAAFTSLRAVFTMAYLANEEVQRSLGMKRPADGATQGYQSLQFIEEVLKLEVLWSPLALLALRFPGFGLEHKEHLARARNSAPWDAFVRTRYSFGSVGTGGRDDFRPRLRWRFDSRTTPAHGLHRRSDPRVRALGCRSVRRTLSDAFFRCCSIEGAPGPCYPRSPPAAPATRRARCSGGIQRGWQFCSFRTWGNGSGSTPCCPSSPTT